MIPFCKVCGQKMTVFSFNIENAKWRFPTTTYECQRCKCDASIDESERSRYYCTINIKNNTIIQEKFYRENINRLLHIIKDHDSEHLVVKEFIAQKSNKFIFLLPNDDKLNYHQMFDKVEKLLPFL